MSVWFAIPSARPDGGTIPLWRERGYKIALWLDRFNGIATDPYYDRAHAGPYPGYAAAVNHLVGWILSHDPQAEWIVTGGDDVSPDPNHTPEEIAKQCSLYFAYDHGMTRGNDQYDTLLVDNPVAAATFGVMQPTGDRWGENEPWARVQYPNAPAYIDRICGSPWMGREFCRRMYSGKGPLFEGYRHMRVDEELQEVAKKLGVLWQRRDLIHYHDQWMRDCEGDPAKTPVFLREVSRQEHWDESTKMFEGRKVLGFPGHEPIP